MKHSGIDDRDEAAESCGRTHGGVSIEDWRGARRWPVASRVLANGVGMAGGPRVDADDTRATTCVGAVLGPFI